MHRRRLAAVVAPFLLAAGLGVTPGASAEPGTSPRVDDPSLGTWSVTAAGPDAWQVAWTSPEPLLVGGDHPRIVTSGPTAGAPTGTDLGTTTLADDGRTVEVTVVAGSEPDPAVLDVVLSGRTLDEVTDVGSAPGSARFTSPRRQLLPVDPGIPGDVPFESDDYVLDPLAIDGMSTPVEMVGHVVRPAAGAAEADDPLVLILHGRHGSCFVGDRIPTYTWPCAGRQEPVPNHLGYQYLQELLASQGFVTVSISANAISAQDTIPDLGAAARAELVQAHLDQWAAWDQAGEETVDLGNVVLVGHSRGGEGVARASTEIPLDAGYRVSGQVLIAPTDFSRQTSPYVPTVTLLPYCDGDVADLMGQSFTDRSRDLTTDDTSVKSSVLVMGANHNFFNTEWTPGESVAYSDDDFREPGAGACQAGSEARLTAPQQRDVGKAYVAGAVRLFALGQEALLPMFDGQATRVPSAGDAVVLSHMLGGGRTVRRPAIDAAPAGPPGSEPAAAVELCAGITPYENISGLCGRYARYYGLTPHWASSDERAPYVEALQVRWAEPGAVGGLQLALDLTGAEALDLRTIVDPKVGDVDVQVRLTDSNGERTQVAPAGGTTVPALPVRARATGGRYWAQTVRVDMAQVSGIDLSHIEKVELVGLSDAGRVWLLDVSSVPPELPPVPEKRMPLVDLGEVTVEEGPAGTQVAEVPYDVVGELESDAVVQIFEAPAFVHERVGTAPASTPAMEAVPFEIPAGTESGTLAWEYAGDDRDSVSPHVVALLGHGVREVLVRDYHGRVEIVDDDPSPKMRFRSPDTVVREGDTTTWVIRLVEPARRGVQVGLEPADGGGSPVRADDLAESWVNGHVFVPEGTNPLLHETFVSTFGQVSTKHPKLVIKVPIRDDDRKETAETLTFRAVTNTGWRSRPITVTIEAGR